jgi:hypothetical protein
MRLPAGTFAAVTTICVSALALLPAASASEAPEGTSTIPIHVTADCSVPMVPTLPASPGRAASCSGLGQSGSVHIPSAPAPGPCASVVPQVDDRCEAWTARYQGPAGGPDYAAGELAGSLLVAASPDSETIFAAGSSDADPSTAAGWEGVDMDLVVSAFATDTGSSRWTVRLPHGDQSFAHNIVADPDGDLVYATSHDYQDVADCVRQPVTVALDQATGRHAWTVRESGSGCISLYSTALDPAGERLFIVAGAEDANGVLQQTVIARDADTGVLLWKSSGASIDGETGSALAVSPDGTRVYAGGSILSFVTGNIRHVGWSIRGYDAATGNRVLQTTWDAPLPNASSPANPPAAMEVSPDGSKLYVVGGAEHISGRSFDITAVAFDTTSGQQGWMYRYDGPRQKSSFDGVWYNGPLEMSADGSRLAIAGYSTHLLGVNLQLDLATVFVNTADGQGLWATRYTAENETNWVPSVALSPDASTVYVSAPSRYAVNWQLPARYTTLAYDAADGTVAWTGRHSDGHSYANGSVLTPDGKTFVVTGMTADAGQQTLGTPDWALGLAAYSTA